MRVRVGSPDLVEQLRRLPASLADARIEWVDDSRAGAGSAACDAVLFEEDGWLVLRMGDARLPVQPGGALPALALAAVGFVGEMLDGGAAAGASRAIDLNAVRVRSSDVGGAAGDAHVEPESGTRA